MDKDSIVEAFARAANQIREIIEMSKQTARMAGKSIDETLARYNSGLTEAMLEASQAAIDRGKSISKGEAERRMIESVAREAADFTD